MYIIHMDKNSEKMSYRQKQKLRRGIKEAGKTELMAGEKNDGTGSYSLSYLATQMVPGSNAASLF